MDFTLIAFYAFAVLAAAAGIGVISVRNPVVAALLLVLTFFSIACTWIIAGAEFLGVSLILVYVGAVMVFMVYVIMMLDPRDPSCAERFSVLVLPAVVAFVLLVGVLGYVVWAGAPALAGGAYGSVYELRQFAASFLKEYWLHFELTSVLLVVAVVAAVAVIQVHRGRHD